MALLGIGVMWDQILCHWLRFWKISCLRFCSFSSSYLRGWNGCDLTKSVWFFLIFLSLSKAPSLCKDLPKPLKASQMLHVDCIDWQPAFCRKELSFSKGDLVFVVNITDINKLKLSGTSIWFPFPDSPFPILYFTFIYYLYSYTMKEAGEWYLLQLISKDQYPSTI